MSSFFFFLFFFALFTASSSSYPQAGDEYNKRVGTVLYSTVYSCAYSLSAFTYLASTTNYPTRKSMGMCDPYLQKLRKLQSKRIQLTFLFSIVSPLEVIFLAIKSCGVYICLVGIYIPYTGTASPGLGMRRHKEGEATQQRVKTGRTNIRTQCTVQYGGVKAKGFISVVMRKKERQGERKKGQERGRKEKN